MKNTTVIILSSILILSFSTIEKTNIPIFKVIIEASYYSKENGMMEREKALKEKINKINLYDNNGELIEWKQFETNGKLYEKSLLTLDENGKLLKGIIYDSVGNPKRHWINDFDKNGNIIEIKTYNSKDELLTVESSKYNSIGNLEKFIYENLEYRYTNKTFYKYNSDNLLVEEEFHNLRRNEIDKRSYKYDEKGNKIEETLERKNGSLTKFINEFDKFNNLTLQKWLDKNGTQIHEVSFTYEYDNYNNWITKKRNLNRKPDFVWERKIEYY